MEDEKCGVSDPVPVGYTIYNSIIKYLCAIYILLV